MLHLARAAAVWTLVVVVGLSALGLLASDATYAGASDERVQNLALDTYAVFLRSVAIALGKLAVVEWAVLTVVTIGVLALVTSRGHGLARRPVLRQALYGGVSIAVVVAFVGLGAAVHPGLFLGVLASSRLASAIATASLVLAPALALASVAGYFVAASRGNRVWQVLFVAVAALVGAAAGKTRTWAHRYEPKTFTIAASATTPAAAASSEKETDKRKGPLPDRPSSILWIAIDSLRPDHIDRENTPHLAALLEESVYFDSAIAPVPRTGPSWSAALTSLEPLTTGIETMFPDGKRADLSTVALPAHLARRGYRTMVASEYAGEFFRRVKVGFEVEAVPRAELMQISGQTLMSRAPIVLAEAGLLYGAGPAFRDLLPSPLGELVRGLPNFAAPETLGQDVRAFLKHETTPAFVLAFYSQPHFPYTSSPAYARRYHVPGSSPSLAYGRDVTSDAPIASDADRRQVDGLYRAALAESDDAIGRLLADLKSTGFLDDAIVVVTADHGEGLYECAECVGHGDNLRGMMTLRVPLAFRLPRKRFPQAKPAVRHELVSLLDVYPTLLSLTGVPPIAIHEGVPLLDGAGAPIAHAPRTLVVETGEWLWTTAAVPKDRLEYPPITALARLEGDRIAIDPKYEGVIRAAKHRAVLRAPYKLVYEPARGGVRHRLFDFEHDPLDTKDLAQERPEVLADLKEALRRSVLRHARVVPMGDWFLTRPPGVPEEHW